MVTKVCSHCEVEKELEQFPTSKRSKDGRDSWCRKCNQTVIWARYKKRLNTEPGFREKCNKKTSMYHVNRYRTDPVYRQHCRDLVQTKSTTPKGKYYVYTQNAKYKKLSFELTFEQFMTFWQKPCNWCGTQIETIGLDRIDSSRGYTIDNVKSCCWFCNRAKGNLTEQEFIDWLERIKSFKRILKGG